MSTQTVINVAQASRSGDFTFTAPVPVPSGIRFATLDIVLDEAAKLAVGNIVVLESRFSPDGIQPFVFFNGFPAANPWVSYGPGGLTVTDPDGTVRVNPNPRIHVPLLTRVGQRIQVFAGLPQTLNAGVFATITT